MLCEYMFQGRKFTVEHDTALWGIKSTLNVDYIIISLSVHLYMKTCLAFLVANEPHSLKAII